MTRASTEGFPVQGPLPQYAAPGVPSPYSVAVHPYPTRYHGGVWTRPVFGLPYVKSVQSVFKPTDFWECQTCEAQSGLGALSYQTHRGIFGENVRGGGIFGEELRGVGAEQAASADGKTAAFGLAAGIGLALVALAMTSRK